MKERASNAGCARTNDLVAFLYDEVNEHEARDFELHLQNCSECKSEFIGFRQVRQSLVAWRDECLTVNPASLVGRNTLEVSAGARLVPQNNRSAAAAVRQFLALSPLWMKGAVAFASVLFCVVAGLAVSHLLEKSQPGAVAAERLYTERELKAKVEEGMQSREQMEGGKDEVSTAPKMSSVDSRQAGNRKTVPPFRKPAFESSGTRRRPLTKSEREQLAADLRLMSPDDEEALDLLDDRLSK